MQERNYLLLRDDKPSQIVKNILRSPLGLAMELIILLNENNYSKLKDNLDKIKQFVAGIERAESLQSKYKLAKFYPTMFAFHQYFHSSFRARQGKVLEVMVQEILRNYTSCNIVPEKVKEMQEIVKDIFQLPDRPTLDIDALGKDEINKKIIIMQLRSRDDTGGTTAKGSLVDFLRDLLRTKKVPRYKVTYLIAIWDERNSQQKKSTISKMYSSLKENTNVTAENFSKNISTGVQISKNILIKLAYGTNEITSALFDWNQSKDKRVLKAIQEVSDTVTNWDDLWISYAISSLEIEINSFAGKNNLTILDKYLKDVDNVLDKTFDIKNIDDLALNIASIWTEDTIPLPSVSDRILYIRDLIYIKLIYNTRK